MELQLVAYVDTTTKVWYLYGELLGGYVELKVGKLPGDVLDRYVIRIEHGPFKWRHHEVVSLVLIKAVAQLLYERILSDMRIKELINIVYNRISFYSPCVSARSNRRAPMDATAVFANVLATTLSKATKQKSDFPKYFLDSRCSVKSVCLTSV